MVRASWRRGCGYGERPGLIEVATFNVLQASRSRRVGRAGATGRAVREIDADVARRCRRVARGHGARRTGSCPAVRRRDAADGNGSEPTVIGTQGRGVATHVARRGRTAGRRTASRCCPTALLRFRGRAPAAGEGPSPVVLPGPRARGILLQGEPRAEIIAVVENPRGYGSPFAGHDLSFVPAGTCAAAQLRRESRLGRARSSRRRPQPPGATSRPRPHRLDEPFATRPIRRPHKRCRSDQSLSGTDGCRRPAGRDRSDNLRPMRGYATRALRQHLDLAPSPSRNRSREPVVLERQPVG